ncbi:hypothetical protein [Microcoleus sp. B9-D4]
MATRNIERNRVSDPKNPIVRSTNYINSGAGWNDIKSALHRRA